MLFRSCSDSINEANGPLQWHSNTWKTKLHMNQNLLNLCRMLVFLVKSVQICAFRARILTYSAFEIWWATQTSTLSLIGIVACFHSQSRCLLKNLIALCVLQVQHGKNAMPAWEDQLDEDEIQAVAEYVYDQSTNDKWWLPVENRMRSEIYAVSVKLIDLVELCVLPRSFSLRGSLIILITEHDEFLRRRQFVQGWNKLCKTAVW